MDLSLPTKELRAQLKTALEALAGSVDRTRRDAGFLEFLRMAARFWEYSPFNQYVIALQRPTATRVAGRRTWESLGRKVKEGERPIAILAPSGGGKGFLPVAVYDVAQTRGRRLPSLPKASRRATRHVRTLERAAEALAIPVTYGIQPGGVLGRSFGGRIEVSSATRGVARVRVLTHELAHELLHQEERLKALTLKRQPRLRAHAEEETEADATAFVVLTALGLEVPSPTYIAWQGGSGAQVLLSMGRIQRAARRILASARARPLRVAAPPRRRLEQPRLSSTQEQGAIDAQRFDA